MAAALVVRGVPEDDTLVWEYYFPYGGPPRWTSGFAQGVAAESLARAGALVADRSFSEAARGRSARSRSGSRWTSGAARG